MDQEKGLTERQKQEIKGIITEALSEFAESLKDELELLSVLLKNPTIHDCLNLQQHKKQIQDSRSEHSVESQPEEHNNLTRTQPLDRELRGLNKGSARTGGKRPLVQKKEDKKVQNSPLNTNIRKQKPDPTENSETYRKNQPQKYH